MKASPETGSLIAVGIVARWTGRCDRTIKRWIIKGHIRGEIVGRLWYVARDDAHALRDGRAPRTRPPRHV